MIKSKQQVQNEEEEAANTFEFFENLLEEIQVAYDKTYWSQGLYDQFCGLLEDGSAADMIAFLLGIKPTELDEMIDRLHGDSVSKELPAWMSPVNKRVSLPPEPEPTEEPSSEEPETEMIDNPSTEDLANDPELFD